MIPTREQIAEWRRYGLSSDTPNADLRLILNGLESVLAERDALLAEHRAVCTAPYALGAELLAAHAAAEEALKK